jgi:hypothetical protein
MTQDPSPTRSPQGEAHTRAPAPKKPADGSPGPHDSEDIDESESTGGSALEQEAQAIGDGSRP